MQAVVAGAYQTVEYIKANIKLEGSDKASITDSKKVVEICTKFAQKGMVNLFLTVLFTTLAFACVRPIFLYRLFDFNSFLRFVSGDLYG